jgi:hypothetical protein
VKLKVENSGSIVSDLQKTKMSEVHGTYVMSNLSLILREEYGWKVFDNRVLRRIF